MAAAPRIDPLGGHLDRHRATWSDVRDVGKIITDTLPSGNERTRIYFGRPEWNGGKQIRISRQPTSAGWRTLTPETAEQILADIRAELLAGRKPLRKILLPYLGRIDEADLVENRVRAWLEDFQRQVDDHQRSPSTLREYRRYAARYFPALHGIELERITPRHLYRWHDQLVGESFGPNTRKKILNAFRACMTHWRKRNELERVPEFPEVQVPAYAAQIMDLDERERVMAKVPWERRGAFLIASTEGIRLSEFRSYQLDDWQKPRLLLRSSIQGKGLEARHVEQNKNNTAEWRSLWNDELIEWLDWRLEQATPQSRARGEVALFWNPGARNRAKRWSPDAIEDQWNKACREVGVAPIPFGEATRHTTFTKLSEVMPDRMLRAFSRHKDGRSLAKYTKAASGPNRDALVRALRPKEGK